MFKSNFVVLDFGIKPYRFLFIILCLIMKLDNLLYILFQIYLQYIYIYIYTCIYLYMRVY